MRDEPRKHTLYLALLTLTALGSVPFAFVGRTSRVALGLPVWLWWSFGFTVALTGVTAWGILSFWRVDDDE